MWRIIWIFFVVLIALILGAVVFISQIDVNQYKSFIEQKAEEALGRKLQIAGDMAINFSLQPTIELNDVSLANSSWATQPDMLNFKTVLVTFNAKALLHGAFDVKSITLQNGGINLETQGNKDNWDFSVNNSSTTNNTSSSSDWLHIEKIELKNIRFKYQQQVVSLQNVDIKASSDWQRITGKGDVIYKNIPIEVTQFDLNEQPKSALYHLLLNASTRDLKLNLTGDFFLNNPNLLFNAKLNAAGQQLNTLSELAGVELPNVGEYTLQTTVNVRPQSWEFDNIDIEVFSGKILANLVLLQQKPLQYQLNLTTENLNAGNFLKALDLTNNISAGTLNAQMALTAKGTSSSALISTLYGNSQFKISNATYHIDERSGVKGDFLSLLAGNNLSDTIELRCITNVMNLQKGVSKNGVSVIDTKGATVLSSGVINFNNGALSLRVNPKGKGVSLAKLAVPLYIKGTLSNPVYIPDPVTLTKSTIEGALNIATLGLFSNNIDPCSVPPAELKKIAVDLPDPDIQAVDQDAESITDKVSSTSKKAWEGTKSFIKDTSDKVF